MKIKDLLDLICPEFLGWSKGQVSRLEKSFKGEARIHRDIIQFLQYETLSGNIKGIWFHVPNEFSGKKNSLFGMKLTLLGRISGAPDLILISPHRSICVEIKNNKGHLSHLQQLFKEWCQREDVPYYVVYNLEDFYKIICKEGIFVKNQP